MSVLATGLVVAGGGGLCALCFRRSWAQALPVFCLGSMALLYLAGLLGALSAGFWLVVALGAAGFVLVAARCVRDKSTAFLREQFLSFGFLAFLLILALVACVNPLRNFIASDEVNFWGSFTQETLRLNALHTAPGSTVWFHQEYPPGITLLQYLWCKFAGGYSEAGMYMSTQFFTLVLFVPMLGRLKSAGLLDKLCLLALVVMLSLPTIDPLYYLVHLDVTLGIYFAYVLYLLLDDEPLSAFSITNLVLACFAACLVKQMGIFILILAAIFLLARLIAVGGRHPARNLRENKTMARRILLQLALCAAGCLAAWLSWSAHLSLAGVDAGEFSVASISVGRVAAYLTGAAPEKAFVLMLLVKALFERPVLTTQVAGLPFFQLMALMFGLALLCWWTVRRAPASRRLAAFAGAIVVGAAAYTGVMLLMYWFVFSDFDAVNLAAFERYMGSYWLAIAGALLMFWPSLRFGGEKAQKLAAPRRTRTLVALTLAAVVFVVPAGAWYQNFVPHTRQDDVYAIHKQDAQALTETVDAAAEKLWVVDQAPEARGTLIAYHYYGNPLRLNQSGAGVATAEGLGQAEWQQALKDGDYTLVYLSRLDEGRQDWFDGLFGLAGPEAGGLYRVCWQNDRLGLEKT